MSLSDIQNLLSTVRRDVEGVSCNQTVGSTRSHLIQYLLHDHDELDQVCPTEPFYFPATCTCVLFVIRQ